jgi:hypothetical protein
LLLESGGGLTYYRAMGRLPFRKSLLAAFVASLVLCAVPVLADDVAPPAAVAPAMPAIILAGLASDPRTPEGYSANVELHVKLHSFPFIGLTVHGTSNYRRPGLYHYQLTNLPRIASKFDDLRYDLGDPTSWDTRYDITMAPASTDEVPILRLTPKKPGGMVAYLDIQTDAKHGRMLKATWTRRDGGTIVLTQTYAALGSADVVTAQHATIDIPHMRAELTATYTALVIDTPTIATVNDR